MKKDPYRYRELISELNDLVSNSDLLPVDEIQILRDIALRRDGYRPIIAWYYNQEDMADIADELMETIEDLDGRATFRHANPEEIADILQYVIDTPDLESMKVADVLRELWEHSAGSRPHQD